MIGDGDVVRDLTRREVRAAGADDLDAMAIVKAKGIVGNDVGDTGDHEVLRPTSMDIEARAKPSRIPIEETREVKEGNAGNQQDRENRQSTAWVRGHRLTKVPPPGAGATFWRDGTPCGTLLLPEVPRAVTWFTRSRSQRCHSIGKMIDERRACCLPAVKSSDTS